MTSSTNNHPFFTHFSSLAALACVLTLSACQGSDSVNGEMEVIDKRSETLLASELQSVNGTYGAGCTDRSGDWSMEIEIGATLDNDVLTVVLNDDGCVLTLTELVTDDGTLAATPPIALTASYKGTPAEFDDPVQYYGNAKLSSIDYASDFVLTFLYSDDPSLATDANTASFEVVESSAGGDSVSVPNNVIDADGLMLLTDTDQIVQSSSGSVGLTPGLVPGQTYVVVDAVGLDTYAELDAAYIAGTPATIGMSIPAVDFTLDGEDLDAAAVKRTLIFANIENGVASYQAFEITFHPAPTP